MRWGRRTAKIFNAAITRFCVGWQYAAARMEIQDRRKAKKWRWMNLVLLPLTGKNRRTILLVGSLMKGEVLNQPQKLIDGESYFYHQ